jgi:hypothetical protein
LIPRATRNDLRAFRRELAEPPAESLGDGGVGNSAPELIELAPEKQPALAHHRAIELLDQGRLADARIAAHEHQRRPALVGNAIESRQQRLDLALSSVESFRDPELCARVPLGEREGLDATLTQHVEAPLQVVLDPERARISVLWILCEQLRDHV